MSLRTGNVLFTFCTLFLFLYPSILAHQKRGISIDNSRSEKRFALVIGNSNYEVSPLRNTVNDARDMAQTLKDLGFEVIYKENVNKNDMTRGIRFFGDKIRDGGVGLFYFAGHGLQVKGLNYLVPVNAELNSEEEVEYECIEVGFVLAQMESARNDMNIIILDACRNNPLARSFRSSSRGLAPINAPRGTLIAYATGPGSVASDGSGRNGIYTQELLRHIRVPNLGIEEVFKLVRISVLNLTQSKQTPWESSSLTRDFYFIGSNAKKTPIEAGVSSSPPINIEPASPDKLKMKGQVVKSSFYTFDLQQCTKSGSTIACDLVITNEDKDRRFTFGDYNSSLFDDIGNAGKIKSVRIANQTGMYSADTVMVSGIPTRARVEFEGISAQATGISLMTIRCFTNDMKAYNPSMLEVRFRDIPLGRRDSSSDKETRGSSGNTDSASSAKPKAQGQVVHIDFFTYSLQQCSKSGSTVVCDLVITNNEKDRRLVFGDYNSILFDDMGNQARVKNVSIANQSGMYFADTTMVSGVSIKARIGFEGISPQATKISLMTILCSTRELNGNYIDHSKVEFRDIVLNK